MPEVADSDGSTILYAALSNPSSRDGSTLRDVDVACFRVLERRGILVAKRLEHETCSSPLLLLLSSTSTSSSSSSPRTWHPSAAWSFPPSWYAGVCYLSLCWQRRRMSSDVLRTVLLVLLDRGWFVVVDSSSSSSLPILAQVRPNFDC